MNINELIDVLREITLEKIEAKSFYIGDKWDNSTDKGNLYPNVWVETPFLIDYTLTGKSVKRITFAIDILMFPKLDNVEDEVNMISHAEELGDLFLQYLKQNNAFSVASATAVSVKNFNADNSCGIRIDIVINTSRVCLT